MGYAPIEDIGRCQPVAKLFIIAENEELFDNKDHTILAYADLSRCGKPVARRRNRGREVAAVPRTGCHRRQHERQSAGPVVGHGERGVENRPARTELVVAAFCLAVSAAESGPLHDRTAVLPASAQTRH